MYTLIVRCTFDAAHYLPDYPGRCARLHGHTYRVEAEFRADRLNDCGMAWDFVELKRRIEEILPDHANLNEVMTCAPTAEHIAEWLYRSMEAEGLPVSAVTVWETDHYGCRYTPQ